MNKKYVAVAVALSLAVSVGAATDKTISVLTVGASFWSAGGQSHKILQEFLTARGYQAQTESARGNPMVTWQNAMFLEGRENEMAPSERTEQARKQVAKDVQSYTKAVGSKPWDYVCFMSHSSEPFEDKTSERADEFVKKIKSLKAEKTKMVAVMTWVKVPADQDYMTIRNYYRRLAAEHGLLLAPSGDAFEIVEKERPDIPIFRSDVELFKTKYPGKIDRHPSICGQYLNSCVVFAVITGESPVGLPCKLPGLADSYDNKEGMGLGTPVDIAPETAKYLQETAWKVVQAASAK